jgi:hypothetical protein
MTTAADQSVQRPATARTTERSDFESRQGEECSVLHIVQTSSAAHLASYPRGIGGCFPVGRAAGA